MRERSASAGNILEINEMWKRKREQLEKQGTEEREERIFQKSKLVIRSPGQKTEESTELVKLITEMREDIKREMREIREDVKGHGGEVKEEIAKIKEEMRKEKEKARQEKEETERRLNAMERRVMEAERSKRKVELAEKIKGLEREKEKRKEEGGEGRGIERGEGCELANRVKEMERKIEASERGGRRRNVILKGAKVEETAKPMAKRVLEEIGVQAKVVEAREIGERTDRKQAMIEVKIESMEG